MGPAWTPKVGFPKSLRRHVGSRVCSALPSDQKIKKLLVAGRVVFAQEVWRKIRKGRPGIIFTEMNREATENGTMGKEGILEVGPITEEIHICSQDQAADMIELGVQTLRHSHYERDPTRIRGLPWALDELGLGVS